MAEPFVTVVVPVYNVERYLDRCVNSIVSQTYKNIEIILVDDGSPDACPQLCEKWKQADSRVRVIHKGNAGLGMARNTGIEHASGDYIFFFDSDDYVAANTVEKCVNKCRETAADTVLFGRTEVCGDKSQANPCKPKKECYDGEDVVNSLLPGFFTYKENCGISACSKMFSMRIIRSHNLRFLSEREVLSEDAIFCLDYFSKPQKVAILEDCLYYYVKNAQSLSQRYCPGRQLRNDDFLRKSLDRINALGLPDTVRAHITARYYMYSVAAMKHVLSADIPKAEKNAGIKQIFNDKMLRSTIKTDALRVTPLKTALFMLLIKLRLFGTCRILLKYKLK